MNGQLLDAKIIPTPLYTMFKQRGGDIESEPVVVYGIWDRVNNFDEVLNYNWLQSKFPDMSIYYSSVYDAGFGSPIYGYTLNLDKTTGVLSSISDDKKRKVAKLHSILLQHHQRHGSQRLPEFGYYPAIDDINGDLDRRYKPDNDIVNSVMSAANAQNAQNAQNEDPVNVSGGYRKTNRKTKRNNRAKVNKRKTRK